MYIQDKSTPDIYGEALTSWHTAWLNCATVGITGMLMEGHSNEVLYGEVLVDL